MRRLVALVVLFVATAGVGMAVDAVLGNSTASLVAGLLFGLIAGLIAITLLVPWTERGRR